MKMWVVRNFFFTSILFFFPQTLIGRLGYYQFFTTVLIRFQSFALAFKSCVFYPTVTSEDVC